MLYRWYQLSRHSMILNGSIQDLQQKTTISIWINSHWGGANNFAKYKSYGREKKNKNANYVYHQNTKRGEISIQPVFEPAISISWPWILEDFQQRCEFVVNQVNFCEPSFHEMLTLRDATHWLKNSIVVIGWTVSIRSKGIKKRNLHLSGLQISKTLWLSNTFWITTIGVMPSTSQSDFNNGRTSNQARIFWVFNEICRV